MRGTPILPLVLVLALLLAVPTPVSALAHAGVTTGSAPVDTPVDVRPAPGAVRDGKPLPLTGGTTDAPDSAALTPRARLTPQARIAPGQAAETAVGTTKQWLALDDLAGLYLKDFTLRGIGEHIEVWVADDLDFPAGDCRNGVRTTVSDGQVDYLIAEFDSNMYPKESAAFSTPPDRDGSANRFEEFFDREGFDGHWAGDGGRIVTLVDNVRDANYYDDDNSEGLSYIAGFHYSVFNEAFDRNVMTIDAFDWLHRTTPQPPHEPSGDPCTNAPARPFLYEGVFAHEYQHLLHYYTDPGETTWIDEGLSDWAQTLTGYGDPRIPVTDVGYDSHIQCIYGNLVTPTEANAIPRSSGGPENSLNLWGDQGDDEVLCDYGAAYSMMEYLTGRYGTDAMTFLHTDANQGLDSIARLLEYEGAGTTVRDVVHDWAAMLAVDGALDRNGGRYWRLDGQRRQAGRYQTQTLDAAINWDNPEAYGDPGAPPNGSDYVRARDAAGAYLSAFDLRSVSFEGATSLPSRPIEWDSVSGPGRTDPDDATLHSGAGNDLDRAIVRAVTVPVQDPVLRFETYFDIEESWDFGFVQVSTDGGRTYESLAGAHTTERAAPSALPAVQDNVPGFTGTSDGWTSTSFDLSHVAGEDVLVAFRYVTDGVVEGPGWWVDDVRVGDVLLSDGSDLDAWQSPTEVRPEPVAGWGVQVVTYSQAHPDVPLTITTLPLDDDFRFSLGGSRAQSLLRPYQDTVGFIVTYDEPTGSSSQYAPYTLSVNGVVQPGGGT